jgi:hypothetical protein
LRHDRRRRLLGPGFLSEADWKCAVSRPEVRLYGPEVRVKGPEVRVYGPKVRVNGPEVRVYGPEARVSDIGAHMLTSTGQGGTSC